MDHPAAEQEDEGGPTSRYAATPPDQLLPFYELTVEMADRVSARRGLANSFFLSVNTVVVAVLASSGAPWTLAVAGVLVCTVWWSLLKSYRELNAAKFEVILELEERLPVRVFTDEWQRLQRGASGRGRRWHRFAGYRELGSVETVVPLVFALIYLVGLVLDLSA